MDSATCPWYSACSPVGMLCEACLTSTHLPSHETYALARPCPQCLAPSWVACVYRGRHVKSAHRRRTDAANRHRMRDLGAAPWPEKGERGLCYCTITPCPRAVCAAESQATR